VQKKDVNEIIRWLTGYSQKGLEAQLERKTDFETFFAKAPTFPALLLSLEWHCDEIVAMFVRFRSAAHEDYQILSDNNRRNREVSRMIHLGRTL
jgi:hypothetical protein